MKRTKEEAFCALRKRIRRATPFSIYSWGAFPGFKDFHSFLRHYFPGKKPGEKLTFEYTKITTEEGEKGVFHILFFGDYLPQAWVSSTWEDLTGTARVVDIRQVKVQRGGEKRIAVYSVNQYVTGGQSEYVRFSNSWEWCFLGFLGKWEQLRHVFSGESYEVRWGLMEKLILGEKQEITEFCNLWDYGMIEQNPHFVGEGVIENSEFYSSRKRLSRGFDGRS